MDKKPYHHLPDGTFRNPEGSPKRDDNVKFSYKIFNAERKKIKINFPDDHIVPRNEVLKNLQENEKEDYVAWIGHATFLIKLGNTTINYRPFIFQKYWSFNIWTKKICGSSYKIRRSAKN